MMKALPPLLLFTIGGASCAAAAAQVDSFFSTTDDSDKQPYITWLNDNASSYDQNTFLSTTADPSKGMAAFWKVDGDDIHIAFATMATGWAAIGIAEAGGMFGADVVSFAAVNPTALVDGYILDDRQVLVDYSQDWTLISSTVEDGWIIVEATRKLDTGDTQDHIIKNDKDFSVAPTRIIAAWGDAEFVSYHGDNKARNSVRIFADPSSSSSESDALLDVMSKNADGYFDVLVDAYEIPAEETNYKYLCKSYDELKQQFGNEANDVTMIGATPIITEETREFVHHFIVFLIPSCEEVEGTPFNWEMTYGWAPGEHGMVLPDDVGFPMFDSENNQAVVIETHYNNPKLISGMKDSSGVRFHYTSTPRLHKAGILQVGDPLMGLYGVEINDGYTQHEFTCPEQCSSLFLDEPVTVITEQLHMHVTGKRMVNEVIRGGEVFHTATVEVFDFDQQGKFVFQDLEIILFGPFSHRNTLLNSTGGFRAQQEPYQLQAGDKFRTTCYYKDGRVFKEGSQDEMCIGYLLYYPAKQFAGFPFICPYPGRFPCAQEYVSTDLDGYEGLGRTFGTPIQIVSNETLSAPITSTQAAEDPTSEAQSNEQMTLTSSSNANSMHCLFVFALSSVVMLIL
jgi:dopamine beta-monooxygenase